MSGKRRVKPELDSRVGTAVNLYLRNEGSMNVQEAMRASGFSKREAATKSKQMRIHREVLKAKPSTKDRTDRTPTRKNPSDDEKVPNEPARDSGGGAPPAAEAAATAAGLPREDGALSKKRKRIDDGKTPPGNGGTWATAASLRIRQSNAALRASEVSEINRVVAGSDGNLSKYEFCHVSLYARPGEEVGIVLKDLTKRRIPKIRELLPGTTGSYMIPPAYRKGCCIASLKSDRVGHARPQTSDECSAFFARAQEASKDGTPTKMELLLIKTKALQHLRRSPLMPRKPWPKPQQALPPRDVQKEATRRSNAALRAAEVAAANRAVAISKGAASIESFIYVALFSTEGLSFSNTPKMGAPRLRVSSAEPAAKLIPVEFRRGCGVASLKCEGVGNVRPRIAEECRAFLAAALGGTDGTDGSQTSVEALLVRKEALPYYLSGKPLPQGRQSPQRKVRLEKWEQSYQALCRYKELHGNLDIKLSDDASLLRWVEEQRCQMSWGLLSRNRELKLNKIGFSWAPEQGREWEKNYQLLLDRKKRYGHHYLSHSDDQDLARWIEAQRELKEGGKLSQEQVAKLDVLEFGWDSEWERYFQLLLHHKEQHGHWNVSPSENPKLVHWIWVQRMDKSEGKMKSDHKAKLNGIKFDWEYPNPRWRELPPPPITTPTNDVNNSGGESSSPAKRTTKKQAREQKEWQKNYKALIDYRKLHGHCNVSLGEDANLALWIKVQQRLERYGMLKQNRKLQLNAIGFVWDDDEDDGFPEQTTLCTDGRVELDTQQDTMKEWQDQYDALVDYKKQHGHCNVDSSLHPKLADWIEVQRARRGRGLLSKAQKMKLNILADMGLNDEGTPATSKDNNCDNSNECQSWNSRYEAIVRFKKRCGIFPGASELRSWLDQQVEAIASLPLERVQKLIEVGVKLSKKDVPKLRKQLGDEFDEWYAQFVDEGTDEEEATDDDRRKKNSKKKSVGDQGKLKDFQPYFWQSPEAAKMFGFAQGDDVRKGIWDRIDLLNKANESDEGWKTLIPNDEKEDLYPPREIKAVKHKALYLGKAYLLALDRMNKMKWGDCCKEAVAQLKGLGLMKISAATLMSYQKLFCVGNAFPHPKIIVEEKKRWDCFLILEYFPMAKEMFQTIAKESIEQGLMNSRHMQDKFVNVILPVLKSESQKQGCYDDDSPAQKMLVKMLETPPGYSTIRKWIIELGIEYDPFCSSRGRDGIGAISRSMKVSWALGKYANRRPKGQGLKRGKAAREEEKQLDEAENVGEEMSDIESVEFDQNSV